MNLVDTQLLPIFKGIAVFGWFLLIFWHEHAWHSMSQHARRWGRNVGLWALNNLLSLTIILPISFWASQHPLLIRPDHWTQTALNIVILDLALYGWHRLCHHWAPLWRLHRIHHLDRWLDSTSALRFHGLEILCAAIIRIPIIMICGIDWKSLVLFETLVLIASIFHHAAITLPPRLEHVLNLVIITPNWHHQHHHPDMQNTNSHYGTLFSFWDRLCHSHPQTGWIRGTDYGLDHQPDRSLWDLLRLR